MVTTVGSSEKLDPSWWIWVLLLIGMFALGTWICYWQSGRILQNHFSNAIDIEKRLSADIREEGQSKQPSLPEDNLKVILYRANLLKSDLRKLGWVRTLSPGHRAVEESLDRVRSSINDSAVFVFEEAFRAESEMTDCTKKLTKELGEIRRVLERMHRSQGTTPS